MANVRVGNSHYIDSIGVLTSKSTLVVGALITATAANGACTLADNSAAGSPKLDFRNAAAGTTQHYRFEGIPMLFPGGVKVSSIANAVVTLIYTTSGDT